MNPGFVIKQIQNQQIYTDVKSHKAHKAILWLLYLLLLLPCSHFIWVNYILKQ